MNRKIKIILISILLILTATFGIYKSLNKTYSNSYFSIKLPRGYKIIEFNESTWIIKSTKDKDYIQSIGIVSDPKEEITREKLIWSINQGNTYLQALKKDVITYKTIKINNLEALETLPYIQNEYSFQSYVFLKDKKLLGINFDYLEKNKELHKTIIENSKNIKIKSLDIIKPDKTDRKKALTRNELLEDVEELIKKIEIHPNLYHTKSKEELEKEFNLLKKEINSQISFDRRESAYILSKFVSKIDDLHSSFIPENFVEFNFFPLRVNVRNGKIFITNKNFSNKNLIGKEIISINNNKTSDIIPKILETKNMDMGNISGKEYSMSKNFYMDYFLSFGNTDEHTIVVKDDFGKTEELKLKGVSNSFITEPIKDNSTFMVKTANNDTVILNFNNFASQDVFTFKRKTLELFKMLEEDQIKNLVIDNRENMGGNMDYVNYFYDFLDEKSSNYSYKNKLYLLSGRSSFSAGEEAPFHCKKINNKTTVIGEATSGGLPFGNPVSFKLKNSENIVVLSSRSFNFRAKGIFTPDVLVTIDPYLEAIGVDQVMDKTLEIIKNNS